MDRVYARGTGRRSRAATEWLACVDDHTVRTAGVAYKDTGVADRVREAVLHKATPETCQDVAEALEACGFSARRLGREREAEPDTVAAHQEPTPVKSILKTGGAKYRPKKTVKFTGEADRNHPFAHGRRGSSCLWWILSVWSVACCPVSYSPPYWVGGVWVRAPCGCVFRDGRPGLGRRACRECVDARTTPAQYRERKKGLLSSCVVLLRFLNPGKSFVAVISAPPHGL